MNANVEMVPLICANNKYIDKKINYYVYLLASNANAWWILTIEEKRQIYKFLCENKNLKLRFLSNPMYKCQNLIDSLDRFCIPFEEESFVITRYDMEIPINIKLKITKTKNPKLNNTIVKCLNYLNYNLVKKYIKYISMDEGIKAHLCINTGASVLPENPNDVFHPNDCEEI